MMVGRCLAAALFVFGIAASSGQTAQAQSRTVKLIVPSTAGGGADVLARLLADQIGKAQSQTIVVENRPGAGNTIGTEAVARAAPDGNTLLITTPEFVINSHLRKLSYDPLTSFAPICYLARSPQLIARLTWICSKTSETLSTAVFWWNRYSTRSVARTHRDYDSSKKL